MVAIDININRERYNYTIITISHRTKKITIYAFVLMDNHFHLIWRIKQGYKRADVQRDFLHFTAKEILKNLKERNESLIDKIEVNLKDRKYQEWQRNSLSIQLKYGW